MDTARVTTEIKRGSCEARLPAVTSPTGPDLGRSALTRNWLSRQPLTNQRGWLLICLFVCFFLFISFLSFLVVGVNRWGEIPKQDPGRRKGPGYPHPPSAQGLCGSEGRWQICDPPSEAWAEAAGSLASLQTLQPSPPPLSCCKVKCRSLSRRFSAL